MADFFRKSSSQNFDMFSTYSWHVPGVGGMAIMLACLLAGLCLGLLAQSLFTMAFGVEASLNYGMLISYPLQFLPAMIVSKSISYRNASFDTGYSLNNSHFGRFGVILISLLAVVSTLCISFMSDAFNSLLPEMPSWLSESMERMTSKDNFLVNLLCVSIFAPFFEEWLCRGTILRGLLNCQRVGKDGSVRRGYSPWIAIPVSALFFAVIHMNPWQALPAFIMGCLFGYFYYRTGSVVITMLMHCTNNTFALLCGLSDKMSEASTWLDILSPAMYAAIFAVCLVILYLIVRYVLGKIPLGSLQGNCDEIPVE